MRSIRSANAVLGALLGLGVLVGCNGSSGNFVAPDTLDVDNDGMLRFPWGLDFDDDGAGDVQFIAGGVDYDDTNAGVQNNVGSGIFGAPTFYAVGDGPTGLYLADFNSDGVLDVVTSNQNNSTATVLFGTGNGSLGAPVTLTVPNDRGGSEAVVGDFNEDRQLDVIAGSANVLFLGTGNRTFGGAIDLGSSGYRNFVRDLNNDGHQDVVGANYGNGVTAILGNGDGTFAAPVNSGPGVDSQSIAIADFDGDDVLDALVVTYEGTGHPSTVGVLLGNGDGSFQAPTFTTLPNYAWQVAAADLNADGHVDVVATDNILNQVYVLLGDGAGNFGVPTTYAVSGAERLAIADYNGDTVPDIAVTSQPDGAWVAFGNGDGSFGSFASSGLGGGGFDVDAGDLNGDGKLDLVFIDISGNRVAVQLGL
ncbi:MAG: VCBS repeat-containing protein [Gammaproteobacteria bacterium]